VCEDSERAWSPGLVRGRSEKACCELKPFSDMHKLIYDLDIIRKLRKKH
jgi:hypothetical protein